MARAVCAAMAEADSGGLARSQLVARAHGPWSQDALEARIDLFVRMGLLRPYLAKAHQQRYVLHPAGMVGLLIIDRIAERRNHDHSRLLGEIGRLNDLVTDNHPDLDTEAYRLVTEAQRYVEACYSLIERILDEGGERRAFSVLAPEEYLAAARGASTEAFASGEYSSPDPSPDPVGVAGTHGQRGPPFECGSAAREVATAPWTRRGSCRHPFAGACRTRRCPASKMLMPLCAGTSVPPLYCRRRHLPLVPRIYAICPSRRLR